LRLHFYYRLGEGVKDADLVTRVRHSLNRPVKKRTKEGTSFSRFGGRAEVSHTGKGTFDKAEGGGKQAKWTTISQQGLTF